MTKRAGPVRTCVGCRDRAAKSDLLRVVVAGSVLVPDPRGRMPGRGAHLHPALSCLDLAERRRAFPRALRVPGPLDASAVRDHLEQRVEHDHEQKSSQPTTPGGGSTDERAMSTQR